MFEYYGEARGKTWGLLDRQIFWALSCRKIQQVHRLVLSDERRLASAFLTSHRWLAEDTLRIVDSDSSDVNGFLKFSKVFVYVGVFASEVLVFQCSAKFLHVVGQRPSVF